MLSLKSFLSEQSAVSVSTARASDKTKQAIDQHAERYWKIVDSDNFEYVSRTPETYNSAVKSAIADFKRMKDTSYGELYVVGSAAA